MYHIILFAFVTVFASTALAAVPVDDQGNSLPESRYSVSSGGHGFRQQHKVGVGIGTAGIHGLLGVNLELNFVPEVSLLSGFGLGPGYQTFSLQVKKVLAGDSFMPYIVGGFARWYSVAGSGSYKDTTPGFLGDRFLSHSEIESRRFSELIIYPAVGIQYLNLTGDWSGFSLYAELMLLVDIDDFVTAPTAGLGSMYYF